MMGRTDQRGKFARWQKKGFLVVVPRLGLSFVVPAERPIYPPPARLITVGLACSHINNLHRKLVLTPKLFLIVSVKCGERERENVENVRVRRANIQLTTSIELGCKAL
jgi:hypothetical protein